MITGKEALIALANGESVEMADSEVGMDWTAISKHGFLDEQKISAPCLPMFFEESERIQFRLKPRTITINGIEVPAPFEPKEDCTVFIIDDGKTCQYRTYDYEFGAEDESNWIGIWRNEEEIKQVVAALRSIFK